MLISSEIEEVISLSDRIVTVYHGHINRMLKREEFLADAVGYAISGRLPMADATMTEAARPDRQHRTAALRPIKMDRPELPPLAFLILLVGVLAFTTNGFLSGGNLLGICQQAAPIAIVALAVNQVIIAGEIDISMGSMVAVLAFIFAGIAQWTGNPWPAILATLICGAAFGSLNGFLSAYAGVPSIVATLGTLMVLRGGLLVVAGNITIYAQPAARFFGNTKVLGMPVEVLIFLLTFIAFALISGQTAFGRHVFAVGGNARAAYDIGIPGKASQMVDVHAGRGLRRHDGGGVRRSGRRNGGQCRIRL